MEDTWRKKMKNAWTSIIIAISFVLLIITNCILLVKYNNLKTEIINLRKNSTTVIPSLSVKELFSYPLFASNNKKERVNGYSQQYTLLYITRIGDCQACVEELKYFNILQDNKEINVLCILGDTNLLEVKQMEENYNIKVLFDPKNRIIDELNLPITPYTLLIENDKNSILLSKASSENPESTHKFIREVINIIESN
ncbi:MAG: redoxin domain-containing protein [Candidatus Moranbacteria bacterium]|jgi:hypothetical protein|nr:redoxin domain-containing protein [Candidatus Moranbacteria bacterium]